MQINAILDRYVLEQDMRSTTVDYYRRVVRVFLLWLSNQSPDTSFCAVTVSRFLLDMQQRDKSAYYRRSLRSGLVALLRFAGDNGRVRPVKLPELDPEAWLPEEVSLLVEASQGMPPYDDPTYWSTLIPAAYHTGLSQVDLERLTRSNVLETGTTVIRRSRTGKRSITWIPPELLESRPTDGPLWPRGVSREMFRRRFADIVRKAGLTGTFKRLRKTSGTEIDRLFPGRGHEHLANSRAIFERHYKALLYIPEPMRLPRLNVAPPPLT